MNVSTTFSEFCQKLQIKNTSDISAKYKRITKRLNKEYWGSDSEEAHCLQVGSYGRRTAVHGVSDLDMVYQLPSHIYNKFNQYTGNGQSALLQDVKCKLLNSFPSTNMTGDGQVVTVKFGSVEVDILPAFINTDNSYTHPDTNNGGTWSITNPKPELKSIQDMNTKTNGNLRNLCKIVRAWKNCVGLNIGGLLIDTLCYNFLNSSSKHHNTSYSSYDQLVRDAFEYISTRDKDQEFWSAPGSRRRVKRKDKFVPKAKKALAKIDIAISKQQYKSAHEYWRSIFGSVFPAAPVAVVGAESGESTTLNSSTEEFIGKKYTIDIRYSLSIDCEVQQNGFRKFFLSQRFPLLANKSSLKFFVSNTNIPDNCEIMWKVRNVGRVAEDKNLIRGQIFNDKGNRSNIETSDFHGPHFVECYAILDGVCIAMARQTVDINEEELI